jgi:hypothetical protein
LAEPPGPAVWSLWLAYLPEAVLSDKFPVLIIAIKTLPYQTSWLEGRMTVEIVITVFLDNRLRCD